jgi:hypothetical protein
MPTAFPDLFLWSAPGLIVFVAGQCLVFRAFFARHEPSLRGLRLTAAGVGLAMLGLIVGIVLVAVARDEWPQAIVVAVVACPLPLVIFWIAGRLTIAD